MEQISAAVIPIVMLFAGAFMFFGKKDYFAAFCHGATEGMKTAAKLLPSLCAVMVALKMFVASGAVKLVTDLLSPVMKAVGIPGEMVPLLVTRPISGAASNGAFVSLMEQTGADSLPAICAAILMGSSDTLVYVIAVYFSGVGIRKTAHAVPVATAVMIFCVFFSCFLARLFFGGNSA